MTLLPPLHAYSGETRQQRKERILAPTTDFLQAELHEALQGGSGSVELPAGRDVFSQPSHTLTFEDREKFLLGQAIFERPWVTAPSATMASDGIGPLFNARACSGCHIRDGRGHPPQPGDANMVSMLFGLSDRKGDPDPTYGRQFQDQAIPGFQSEGQVDVRYDPIRYTYPDGKEITLRKPVYDTEAPLGEDVSLNPRIAPPMIGLGLIEAIEATDIAAAADPDDTNGDGISGRAHWLGPTNSTPLGRFGWKATAATVLEQSATAFHNDMGLSTSLMPNAFGDCTEAQMACRNAIHGDQGGLPEISDDLLNLVVFYSSHLALPARANVDDPLVLEGKSLFYKAGCTACHTPKFATASDAPKPLRNQLIWPYSDFLLHDLGPALADINPTGNVAGSEWRTQPLWAIGRTKDVNGHTFFLHDGRARSLEEAILWHGGEAQAARDAFAAMSEPRRKSLIRFLESL